MANGTVDNRLLGSTLGSILRQVNLLDLVGRGGTSEIQCFAARLDASHGIATVRSLVLASSLLTMDGSGSLNLGAETFDLRVRPQARVAGTSLVVPMRISGRSDHRPPRPTRRRGSPRMPAPWREPCWATRPRSGWSPARWAAKHVRRRAGLRRGLRAPAARGRRGPPPQAQPAPQQQQKPPNLGGMLKQLFR